MVMVIVIVLVVMMGRLWARWEYTPFHGTPEHQGNMHSFMGHFGVTGMFLVEPREPRVTRCEHRDKQHMQ